LLKFITKYSFLLISWSLLILALTLIPFDSLHVAPEINIPWFDKMVHTGLFGIHVFLMSGYLTVRYHFQVNQSKMFAIAAFLSLSFGLLIELIQYFIPERNFEMLDLLADFFGILIGILIFYVKFHFFTN
jgi:VanZ family protein